MSLMELSERQKAVFRIVALATAFAVVISAGYGSLVTPDRTTGLARGGLTGGLICLTLTLFEVAVMEGRIGQPLRQAPFLLHLAVKTLVYLAVFVAGGNFATHVFPDGDADDGLIAMELRDIAFAFSIAFVINVLLAVNRLLGQHVLLNIVTGRYRRPRIEERVFLFLDMAGSTGIAERIGDVAFHRLLDRCVRDLTVPIVERRGQIYRYVGDEMIVTWPAAEGLSRAACVHAGIAALEQIRAEGPSYERDFGVRPEFRAALHIGSVVSGEMGSIKREITYLGDTVNVTARIEQIARQVGRDFLLSGPLLARLTLPAGVRTEPLGAMSLRGRTQELELHALRIGAAPRVMAGAA